MSWNPAPVIYSANWQGNPPVVTTKMLTSTSASLYGYTSTTSNVLQTEINSIVAGGTTSLWANYPAINNVTLANYNLVSAGIVQARFFSTMDLQVSSINGAEVQLTSSNVTIQNVTMKDGTVTSSNSSSSNTTLNRVVGAVNAVAGAVTNINTAVGGFLSNNFGVLQQAYYGVATAGQIVDLANGTVQLATGIQAMVDSRQQNSIAGPGGPPGQTSYVYETFNHTTQFQFSTLATPVYTVYRTTDQANPNQTFGREIFISTIIPAGSKVVRSVSDPFNMPIASTQLLSTTNYIQSFGQWQAILGTDYNLVVPSTLTAGNISTLNISTGAAFISSLNGQPASNFLNTNTFDAISATKISSATITASTIYSDKISTGLILGAGYNGSLIFGDIANTNYIQTFANTGAFIRYTVPTGTLQIDSGNLILGYNSNISFNGSPYAPVNPDLTLNTLTVPSISTTRLQASNAFINNLTASTFFASTVYIQNIVDNYVSTTIGEFDIVNTSTLIASQITTNTIQTNAITGLQKLSLADTVGNSYSVIFPTKNLSSYVSSISLQQSGYFNFETNAAPSPPVGIVYINNIYGVWVYPSLGPNFGTTNSLQQTVYIQPGYAGTPSSGSVTFYAINSPGFNVNFIQQGDGLISAATPFIVQPGWYVTIAYTFTPGYYQNATYTVTYNYQPIPGSATSTLTKSLVTLVTDTYETVLNTSNNYQNSGITTGTLGNLALNVSTIIFGSNTSRNNVYPYQFTAAVQAPLVSTTAVFVSSINGTLFSDLFYKPIPYLSSFSISTGQAFTSSIQMTGGLIISTPLALLSSAQYDISKTVYLASTSFSTISSFQNNILSYNYSATIGDEVAFNMGAGYNIEANNVSQWASTCIQGNNVNNPMTIEIDNDPAGAFLGTGTFDVQRIPVPGNTPYDIAVQYSLGGAVIVDIGFSDFRLYRFTKSSTGVGGWTYVINPTPYATSNNNTFQIYQNLTDVTIATTDNLNLNAGSIKLNGSLQLSNVNVTKAFIQSAQISSLTATNIQFQNLSSINHQTNNESVTNLYAGYINTSSININTQQSTPMILGNYSNTYDVLTYFTPPPNQIITHENDMTVTSANPSFTYTGPGTDVITFDIGGLVKVNGTLYTNTNWFYSLWRINNSVRLNISTVAGGTCNANFPANTNITNFIVKGGNTLGFYTSASGFIGNVTGGSITLYWTSLNDFSTTSYVPWTGLTYQSKQQITQTVSSVYFNATCPQYISSPTLNIYTNPSSNNPTVKFGGRTVEVFSQRVDGFIANAGNYGKGDVAATIRSPTGKNFPVSQYNCVVAQSGANIYGEAALALNEQVWQTYQDGGGNWAFHFYCTTATIPGAPGPNFYAIAGITMIPYDLGGFSGYQSPDHLGEGNGGPPVYPLIQLSTIFASTMTLQAYENFSLLAGNVSIPTYISTGSITVLGTNNVSVLGNVLALGGNTEVDIQALNSNINLVANYDINATATHAINLSSPSININGAVGIGGTLYMNRHNIEDVQDLYIKRNLIFQSTSTYIADLGHIYGNTSAPGGGLGIDYMYGLFFNSAGNDANLYASGGYFYLRNMARGVEVGAYNPAGTGDSAFYVASNDLYLATGTGHDVITNSGRNIAMNAAQSNGFISLYTSTINTTSLLDTNMFVNGNYNLTGGGASHYITLYNAGTSIQFAGANIYVGTSSGGFNFNINVAIGSAYQLNLQNAPIYNASNISGTDINLTATSNIRLNGLTTIKIAGTSAIASVSPLALTNGNDYAGTSRSQIEFQFNGGGFNHYISTRHNANLTYNSGNAIDFWLYSYNGGSPQTGSSSPGTGNVNTMSLTASNVVINRPLNIQNNSINNTSNINGTLITVNATSNLNLYAGNYVYISSTSYMNTDVYGDMTTDLGGVYTVTSAEVINLNATRVGITATTSDITLTMNSSDTGGVIITDTNTGGTGRLTVDSGNHLYWNGTLIA